MLDQLEWSARCQPWPSWGVFVVGNPLKWACASAEAMGCLSHSAGMWSRIELDYQLYHLLRLMIRFAAVLTVHN